jgi:hypothetical protein
LEALTRGVDLGALANARRSPAARLRDKAVAAGAADVLAPSDGAWSVEEVCALPMRKMRKLLAQKPEQRGVVRVDGARALCRTGLRPTCGQERDGR